MASLSPSTAINTAYSQGQSAKRRGRREFDPTWTSDAGVGNSDYLCKHPQAKGCVERVNLTLQDRLVKEMRLLGISSMEEGNAFMSANMEDFNSRFALAPRSNSDTNRPLLLKDNLEQIFTWQETRTLSKNLTIQFRRVVYQIQTERPLTL